MPPWFTSALAVKIHAWEGASTSEKAKQLQLLAKYGGRAFPFLSISSIPLLTLILNLITIPGYTGDDAYIHFTYVRNILEHGRFSYNSLDPTYGSSSILWVLLGSLFSFFTGEGPNTMRVLSGAIFFLNAHLFAKYLKSRFSFTLCQQLFCLALYMGNAVSFRWLLTGMETNLIQFMMLVFLLLYNPDKPIVSAAYCLWGYLVRPELLLVPICQISMALWERRVLRKPSLKFILATSLLFLCWFLTAYLYFGSMLPLTSIKSGYTPEYQSFIRLCKVVAGTFPIEFAAIATLLFSSRLRRAVLQSLKPNERLLMLFGVGLLSFYALSGTNVISRYLAPMHIPLCILIVSVVTQSTYYHRLPYIAALVLTTQTLLFFGIHYYPIREFVAGFQTTYSHIGHLIEKQNEQDTSSVILSDVGMVGYYSRRPIVDLVGLTSNHVHIAHSREIPVLASIYRPRFLIIRLENATITQYIEELKTQMPTIEHADVVLHEQIGRMGVADATTWHVYVLDLQYKPTAKNSTLS